jgi:hypothetical protein
MAGPTLQMPEFNDVKKLLTTVTKQYILDNYMPMQSIQAPMAV